MNDDYNNNSYNRYDSTADQSYYNAPEDSVYVAPTGEVGQFIAKVFGWMFFGLLVTAGVSFAFVYGLHHNETLLRIASQNSFLISICVAELVAVIAITWGISKLSPMVATLLFILYAALNGLTISYVVLAYAGATVTKAFIMTAIFFGVMALYGAVTHSDMSRVGHILLGGLIALVLATLVNFFMRSPMLDYILSLAGLGLFAGLTAYDVQKLKRFYHTQGQSTSAVAQNMPIYGALMLYLDFINMFLYLLRLLGRRK